MQTDNEFSASKEPAKPTKQAASDDGLNQKI